MLEFTCPSCGCHKVARRVKGEHVEIYSIIGEELELDNEEMTEVELACWECGQCDYMLKDNQGDVIKDSAEQVLAWIELNCN